MTIPTCTVSRLTRPFALAALAGLAMTAAASAAPVLTAMYPNVPSYKNANTAGNATRTINFGAFNGTVRQIRLSGTLTRVTPSTFPREAAIRITRMINLAPNIGLRTHEMIAQPFATTTWDANGQAQVDAVVLLVPDSLNFNGDFSAATWSEPGYWSMEFFEQFDDNAADASATPDAVWSNIQIQFESDAPSLETAVPETGAVATTTRYGVRSNDTLGVGAFNGGLVQNINKPAGNAIRHVRVSGYLTGLVQYLTAPGTSALQTGQARLRLVRNESVLLSPNDPQALNRIDELFVAVPANTTSTGYVSIDIPLPPDSDFGKLTRNVPSSQNESYGGITYFANAYESTDDSLSTDSIWNALKIEFFTGPQPGSNAVDMGTLNASPAGTDTVTTATASIPAGLPAWFKFELPVAVSSASAKYLDIDTENTSPLFDTVIGLYHASGPNAGQRIAFDDDDGSGTLSQMTFGSTTVRPAIGSSAARNGRDGGLAAGTYYVAAIPFDSTLGTSAMGATGFNVSNPDTTARTVRLNLRYNVPTQCTVADIVGIGGLPPADGFLTGDDFDAFIAAFAGGEPLADIVGIGGLPPADGLLTGDDFNAFIAAFAAGCP